MTNTMPVRSYQNCSENDVVGYNDCPESLFVMPAVKAAKKIRPRRIPVSVNTDTQSSKINEGVSSESASKDDDVLNLPKSRLAKASAVPPPPIGRRSTSSSVSSLMCDSPTPLQSRSSSMSTLDNVSLLDENELMKKVANILNAESKLSNKEYEYYKGKIDSNLEESLKNDKVRIFLSRFFSELESSKNKEFAQKILLRGMTSDTTINSWCPAFHKIFDNASFC
ncbi:uncharacterized protein CGFF_01201 [Nakaseomyces glabratus]|nr:hypothetical protein J6894_00676 [Nakaseomyces glabratus]QNG12768.1 uncharacterized protein GWK60_D00319 [Nakaseomyces glabratus]SCV13644.1 uncharacterized protein CGFF_01201 [Nakaseomyces glabratus]SLM11832.1 uncharacterized protein CGFF_01201 [Nakaseomyces glabratus]